MAQRFDFTPNNAGFRAVRSLPAVTAAVDAQLQRIAGAAGDGYQWESHDGRAMPQGRRRGTVYPNSWKARQDNAANNTLVRALGSG